MGFLVIDRIAQQCGVEVRNRQCHALTARAVIGSEPVLLAKPETFMNLSGMSVRELVAKHEVRPESDLIVIYDELDLPLGMIRIRQRGSSAGHNGMESVIGALGTKELKVVDEVLDTAAEAVNVILKEGPAAAMNRFNRKNELDEEPRNPRPDLEK